MADEIKAMSEIKAALVPLDDAMRLRVLQWAESWVDDHRRDTGPFGILRTATARLEPTTQERGQQRVSTSGQETEQL